MFKCLSGFGPCSHVRAPVGRFAPFLPEAELHKVAVALFQFGAVGFFSRKTLSKFLLGCFELRRNSWSAFFCATFLFYFCSILLSAILLLYVFPVHAA